MSTRRLPKDAWLHRDAPDAVDAETWCLVRTGDPLLTRRARACSVYGHVLTTGYKAASSAPYGGLVRHAELAAQLSKGSPAEVKAAATNVAIYLDDAGAGTALCGSWHLAAAIVNQHAITPESWALAGTRAVATGAPDPDGIARRVPVFTALVNAGRRITATDLEVWDIHVLVAGAPAVILAIRAGYGIREITPEQLMDTATLSVAAALNQREW